MNISVDKKIVDNSSGMFSWKNRFQEITILDILKIAIILLASYYLLANFNPFYYGADTIVYGTGAIGIATGSYEYTNELLNQTGNDIFLPVQWVQTIHNTGVPLGGIGLPALGAIFYFLGGEIGLFYLGPIFTILLIVSSERVATKIFGKGAGFFVLIFPLSLVDRLNSSKHLLVMDLILQF